MSSVERFTKGLSDVPDDIVLNFVAKSNSGQSNTQSPSCSFHENLESLPYLKQGKNKIKYTYKNCYYNIIIKIAIKSCLRGALLGEPWSS